MTTEDTTKEAKHDIPPLLSILLQNAEISEAALTLQNFTSPEWILSQQFKNVCNIVTFQTTEETSSSCFQIQTTIQMLQKNLKVPKENDKDNNNEIDDSNGLDEIPSLHQFRAVLKLVQFLNCHPTIPSRIPQTLHHENCENSIPVSKISSDFIQRISNCICHFLSSMPSFTSSPYMHSIHKKVIFTTQVILHDIIHQIIPLITIHSKGFLLPPIWRAICDIAHYLANTYNHLPSTTLSYTNNDKSQINSTEGSILTSINLIKTALTILIKCLLDGEESLRKNSVKLIPLFQDATVLASIIRSDQVNENIKVQQDYQRKIVTFLLARLTSLFTSFRNLSTVHNTYHTKDIHSISSNLFLCLAKLRGISEGAQIWVEEQTKNVSVFENKSLAKLQLLQKTQLMHATQIGQKVEQTCLRIILNPTLSPQHSDENKIGVDECALKVLASMKESENNASHSEEGVFFNLGKLLIQKAVLGKMLNVKTSNFIQFHDLHRNIFDLAQSILEKTIPHCHIDLTYSNSCSIHKASRRWKIISNVVGLLVDCTLKYNEINDNEIEFRKSMILSHKWMTKWMDFVAFDDDAINQNNSDFKSIFLNHPLQRELAFSIVRVHCSYLWQRSRMMESSRFQQQKHQFAINHLIALFTNLILDSRTHANIASNLSVALFGIVSLRDTEFTLNRPIAKYGSSSISTSFLNIFNNHYCNMKKNCNEDEFNVTKLKPHQVKTISAILESIPSEIIWSVQSTASDIKLFCNETLTKKHIFLQQFSWRTSSSFTMMLSYLIATVINSPLSNAVYDRTGDKETKIELYFREMTGTDLFQMVNILLRIEIEEHILEPIIHASLSRFLRIIVSTFSKSLPEYCVRNLLEFSSLSIKTLSKHLKSRNGSIDSKFGYDQMFEIIKILGFMGNLITSQCPVALLDVSKSSFARFI